MTSVGRAGHDGALDDHRVVAVLACDRVPDGLRDGDDRAEINAVGAGRRPDRDERYVRRDDGRVEVGRRVQPRTDMPLQELLQSGLMDRDSSQR